MSWVLHPLGGGGGRRSGRHVVVEEDSCHGNDLLVARQATTLWRHTQDVEEPRDYLHVDVEVDAATVEHAPEEDVVAIAQVQKESNRGRQQHKHDHVLQSIPANRGPTCLKSCCRGCLRATTAGPVWRIAVLLLVASTLLIGCCWIVGTMTAGNEETWQDRFTIISLEEVSSFPSVRWRDLSNLWTTIGHDHKWSVMYQWLFDMTTDLAALSIHRNEKKKKGTRSTNNNNVKTNSSPKTTTHDVIIVGAGCAGLYAAKTLLEMDNDYKVLILEATDRIGGRVHSETLGDIRVELGAEEHYTAQGNNPVWPAITKKYKESIYTLAYQGPHAFSLDGGTHTCWTTPKAKYDCDKDPDMAKTNISDVKDWIGWPMDHPDPLSTLADDVGAAYGVAKGDRIYHIYENGLAGFEYATTLQRLGGRSLALQESQWDLSDDVFVLGDKNVGYSDALETIWWDNVQEQIDLLFNRPVVRIDSSSSSNYVIVTDSHGQQHAARQVIVTVSIGVLQSEMIDFVPDLPNATVAAYNGLGIDHGMKIPLRFKTAWWETEGVSMALLVTEGLATACWVPSDYKSNSTSYILMCYPMADNARTLDAIANQTGGGAAGVTAILEAVLADLDATFPKPEAVANNSEGNGGVATANFVEGRVQNWGTHAYTWGAYSYPKLDTYNTVNDNHRQTLQMPVANNRIFIAGEATNLQHPATVVGALHEGERAAHQVHDR